MPAIHFSPEELASVGYKAKSGSTYIPSFSAEELASVGYKPPQDPTAGDTAKGFGLGMLSQASDLLGTGIKNVGTLVGSKGTKEFGESRIDNAKFLRGLADESSRTAAEAGDMATNVLGAIALPGSSIPALAASGAAVGLASKEGESPIDVITEMGKGAALSAGIGAMISGASKLVQEGSKKVISPLANVIQHTKELRLTPDEFAKTALDATLKKTGGKLPNATPEDVVEAIAKTQQTIKGQANSLYGLRDSLAEAGNVMVSKTNLRGTMDDLSASIRGGATSETRAAMNSIKGVFGSGAPITFAKAQSLVSDVGKSINKAVRSGDSAAAFELGKVKDALMKDIDGSAGVSEELKSATQTANSFYRDVYSPIKSLKVADAITGKVTEDIFVSNLLKRVAKSPAISKGVQQLDDETKMAIVGAHQRALLESKIPEAGTIDLAKYSQILGKDIQANKQLYKDTSSLEDLQTLAQVLSAAGVAKQAGKLPGIFEAGAITAGFGVTANPAFLGIAAYKPAKFLYAAGKMLNNDAAKGLLKSMRDVQEYPQSSMFKMTQDKIGKLFSNQIKTKSRQVAALFGSII